MILLAPCLPVKKILCAFVCLLFFHVTEAQTLTDKERDYLIQLLEENEKKFLASIENVTEAQWTFKPEATTWSVGEISEHITLAEDLLFSITQKTLQTPADDNKGRSLEGREQEILDRISDRSSKAQAPEVIRPSGKFAGKKELIAAFKLARQKTISYIKATNDPLKNHIAVHPAVGELTAYQWLVFIAGHANRHVAQLGEVKSNGAYPKI